MESNNIITQEQFEILMYSDIPYEGFVIGIGYVLPEVTIVANPINEHYKTEDVAQNSNYNIFIFQENVEKINGIFNPLAKGMHFGLNQRYGIMPEKWMKGSTTVAGIIDRNAGKIKNGKPVGEWLLRVDKPHGKTNFNHLNINESLTGIKDPHTRISAKTLNAFSKVGKTFTVVGKVAKPVAIVTDVIDIAGAYSKDNGTIGKNTVVTTSKVAGGWTGAWGGAQLGTSLGASIGTCFAPGVGTAIGGFIGAVGFGILGAFGGSWLAEESATIIYDKASQ